MSAAFSPFHLTYKTSTDAVGPIVVMGLYGFGVYGYVLHCVALANRGYVRISVVMGIVFVLLSCIWVITYLRCLFHDAGTVPPVSVDPDLSLRQSLGIEVPDESTSRTCRTCQAGKPPRAHHCSMCKRCVLKMDHHCPWVGNCVGFANYKFFVLFLFWSSVLGLYSALTMLPSMFAFSLHVSPLPIMIVFFIALVFGLALGAFFWQHVVLMTKNQTTIESMGNDGLSPQGTPWNISPKINVSQVLGENVWLWAIPVATTLGDGKSWPQRDREGSHEGERLLAGQLGSERV